jgi:hypothetical protein
LVSVDQLLGHGGNDLLVKLTADFQELEGGSPGSLRKRVIQASLNVLTTLAAVKNPRGPCLGKRHQHRALEG